MSTSLAARGNSIFPITGVDLSAALGKLVLFTAGVPAVSASATVPAQGIVLEAAVAAKNSSIGLLGGDLPPVRGLISGASAALKFGDRLMQAADGTFTKDVGPGTARVVVAYCGELGGAVAGDLAIIVPIAPMILP